VGTHQHIEGADTDHKAITNAKAQYFRVQVVMELPTDEILLNLADSPSASPC